MNKINFDNTGGFPLGTYTLSFMQSSCQLLNALGNIAGNLTILAGCEQVGKSTADGVVYIDGEVLPFKGAPIADKVIIVEEPATRVFKDGQEKVVELTRYATFGNSINGYLWKDFKRPLNTQQIEAKAFNEEDSLLKRLEELESRMKKVVPIGLIAVWGKPASEPIPEGWREYKPLSGRMPIGLDRRDERLNTVGNTGGNRQHTLTVEELPRHKFKYEDTISVADIDAGEAEYFKSARDYDRYSPTGRALPGAGDTNNTMRLWKDRESSEVGTSTPFDIMPPYHVIQFIEFVGFN